MKDLEIEFISQKPNGIFVYGIASYDEYDSSIYSEAVNGIRKQSPRDIIDVAFIEKGGLQRYVISKLGEKDRATRRSREEAGAALFKKASDGTEELFLIDIRELGADGLDLLTGILLSRWDFDKYKTLSDPKARVFLTKVAVLCSEPNRLEEKFKPMQATVEGTLYARSLTSEPPNVFFPAAYAERVKELEGLGVEVEVLAADALRALGMTAILAVGQGSIHDPAVVVFRWNGGSRDVAPVALVGKGICFDSGGLCLKATAHQCEMKWDKAGAGVVAGAIKALALANAPINIVGVIGLAENMPDGSAIKPGDIIQTMSGQTIEIINTDAEGRLVLADCIWYVQEKYKPSVIVDLGTLTIETFAALGSVYGGLYSNSGKLAEELEAAGEVSGDLVWELPMGPFFAKQIESSVADMKNVGIDCCGENGSAAEFLRRFIKGDCCWAHLDISGVSWTKDDQPLSKSGVTGFGVRLLVEWLTGKKR